jgi:hypothetical protein
MIPTQPKLSWSISGNLTSAPRFEISERSKGLVSDKFGKHILAEGHQHMWARSKGWRGLSLPVAVMSVPLKYILAVAAKLCFKRQPRPLLTEARERVEGGYSLPELSHAPAIRENGPARLLSPCRTQ